MKSKIELAAVVVLGLALLPLWIVCSIALGEDVFDWVNDWMKP